MSEPRINRKYLTYSKEEVEGLLEAVESRKFFRPMTQEEYDDLSEEERMNGDLYLIVKKKERD